MSRRRWWHRIADRDRDAVDFQGTKWFVAAGEKNYTKSTGQRDIKHIVIHITGGPAMDESSSVNEFRSSSKSSSHYIVNRRGEITQMVREADIAHHAHSGNANSIGIEHVNPYMRRKKKRPTEKQYRASAELVAYLCLKYKIHPSRSHSVSQSGIIGHMDVDTDTGHQDCPNEEAWDWEKYLEYVSSIYYNRLIKSWKDLVDDIRHTSEISKQPRPLFS